MLDKVEANLRPTLSIYIIAHFSTRTPYYIIAMSSFGGIGATLTGGIQDVAAILPLLGTEQCSVQVSSALTRGYLYAAATPISIFGSLGVVNAGFKTLVSCFSFGNIEGAKILGNMGFEPQGENLSLIMVEAGKGKTRNEGRYIIETRMDELIKELNIDKNRITGVSHKSTAWNVKMMATTALLCAFSITPYIYLNLGDNHLEKSTTWLFPVLRATGGFITTTLVQLLIQRRITTLSNQYLLTRDQLPNMEDIESGNTKKRQMDARTWLLLCVLLMGLVASVVGYVGCFSVVQNSTSNTGPISWLCLESGLSLLRLVIWAYNPTSDDAPPLEINIELDKFEHKLFPTCNKDDKHILLGKLLPLTRARDFLKIITSFTGLIEPFSNPDLSLYYTLTRDRPYQDVRRIIEKLGEWTLYIIVFDHKERTTRVYTRDNEMDIFYSTTSDAPFVDVGHFLLEVEIDAEMDPRGDPVSSDSSILDSLRKHYLSILEHIQYRLGVGDVTIPYAIENSWTIKAEDTLSTLQKLREEGNRNDWETVVEMGKEAEDNETSSLISDYFTHFSIDRDRRRLDKNRVEWIARRMEVIADETKERFQGMGVEYRVNMQAGEKKPATKSSEEIERQLDWETFMMELLLLYEVTEWELLFWKKFKDFLVQIGDGRVEVKERLTREWKANCWKRLNPQMHAVEQRLAKFKTYEGHNNYLEIIGERWTSSINQFLEGVENPYPPQSEFRERMEKEFPPSDVCLRLEKEMEDIEFRLKRGSELGQFNQCWPYDTLFRCRYSRSKWLYVNGGSLSAPLEVYLHALKGNKSITHIIFDDNIDDSGIKAIIRELPSVTSISRHSHQPLPAICHEPLLIDSPNDLITFGKEIRPKLDAFSTYIFTDVDSFDLRSDKLGHNARILFSFVAPPSDESLVLRLKHSGEEDGPLVVTLGSTIQLNPSSKSPLTIDDVTLYPNPGPGRLSFVPGRNDILIQFAVKTHGHLLHDIELLDKTALEDPRNHI